MKHKWKKEFNFYLCFVCVNLWLEKNRNDDD
jgi:hypothetical protein